MDNCSQETLRRIEQNDTEFTGLQTSSDASDYSRLGVAIGNNTHLKTLVVALDEEGSLDVASNEFFDGLKRNSSINDLELNCMNQTLVGGVGHIILKSYQKNNNNLTRRITDAVLDNGGGNVIAETVRWCRNLRIINFGWNNITDEQLLPIVESIRGHRMLENLYLYSNRIGNVGCRALATLLEDPSCNLKLLKLNSNRIGNEGATAIANSLVNNINLKILDLNENPFEPSLVGIFCTMLCNTSSVNDMYRSNHTLKTLVLSDEQRGQHANHLATLQRLNRENKRQVAIKKILKYHPNIDMEPLFEWDTDGEQSLKALPYIFDWFKRAGEAVAGDIDREDYHVEEKKLSAIFQFAKAMPLLVVPASNIKEDDKKRKRIDM